MVTNYFFDFFFEYPLCLSVCYSTKQKGNMIMNISVEKAADSIYNWLIKSDFEVFRDDARKSSYITIELPNDIYRIRISDHSAEVSSYHWGEKAAVINVDLVIGEGKKSGKEYADATTVSKAAQIISKDLNIELPAKYKDKKKYPAKRKPTTVTIQYEINCGNHFHTLRAKVYRHTGTMQRRIERKYFSLNNAERGIKKIQEKYGKETKIIKIE